jgi:hypothetical protein
MRSFFVVHNDGRPFRSVARLLVAVLLVGGLGMAGLAPADAATGGPVPATANLMLASHISLSASANPALLGVPVTVTATVALISGNPETATGSLTFFDGGVSIGTGVLSGGAASWTGQFAEGSHNLTASYSGDSSYQAGISPVFVLPVTHASASAAIAFPGASGPNLTTDGSTVEATVSATSPLGGVDFPRTRFNVSFAGVAGLTSGNLQLQQQLTDQSWVDVQLSGSPLTGVVGAAAGVDLPPGTTVTVPLRFNTQPGTPIGPVSMTADLVGSADGGATFPNQLAHGALPVNIIRLPSATTVAASSVLTNALTAPVPMHATVTPNTATGSVDFLDNGVLTGTGTVANGVADYTATVHTGAHTITATYSGDGSLYAPSTTTVPAQITVTPAGGAVHALTPRRILDTRNGIGAPRGRTIPANGKLILQVSGAGNLPTHDIEAVILNMTIRTSSAAGYLTMYPSDQPAPFNVSSLTFDPNVITAGLTIVPVSASGTVTIVNHSTKPIDLLADSGGFFANQLTSLTLGGRYNGFAPFRLLDTTKTPMKLGAQVVVKMTGRSSGASKIPATGVASVMLEVTGNNPSGDGFVSAYPNLTPYPDSSVLNFSRHVTRANRVIVAVGTDGAIILKNSKLSTVGLLVEVVGYFTSETNTAGGTTYVPLKAANRLVTATWPNNAARYIQLAGRGGLPVYNAPQPAVGVIANVSARALTAATLISVYPSGTHPIATDLVIGKGLVVSNLIIARIENGRVILWNRSGNTGVNVDIFGWFG